MLACAYIEEGIVLRRAGVQIPILVFGALGISDLDGVFEYGLTPTISTPSAARALAAKLRSVPNSAAAAPNWGQTPNMPSGADPGVRPRSVRYHLKIDTGMNRLGFRHDNLERTLPELMAQSA